MIPILRRVRVAYLFSFVTAVIYGFALDGCLALVALVGDSSIAWRVAFYAAGLLMCSIGVALFFRTYTGGLRDVREEAGRKAEVNRHRNKFLFGQHNIISNRVGNTSIFTRQKGSTETAQIDGIFALWLRKGGWAK